MAIQTQLPMTVRQGRLPQRAADRTKAFRAALRHSSRVRFLKLALPLSAVAVMALYFLPGSLKIETKVGTLDTGKIDLSKDGFKMTNPKMSGIHEKHGRYLIEAAQLTQNAKQPEFVTLYQITAELTSLTGGKTKMTAPGGLYHSKKEELTFDKGVDIGGDSGLRGHLKTATAYVQNHVLISADPVDFAYYDSTIKSEAMTAYTNESRVMFTGNVQAHLERQQKPVKPVKVASAAPGGGAEAVPGSMSLDYSKNAHKPVDITSHTLEVDDKKKIATFREAVSATQGDFNMRSLELVVVYSAGGGAKNGTGTEASPAPILGTTNGDIKEIRAHGEVILTSKDSQECHGDDAIFDAQQQLVTLQGNVQCSKAENVIKGDRMVINLIDNTTKVDNVVGGKPGRINVVLQPKQKENKPKKPAPDKAAAAAAPGAMSFDYSQNANKPVNVSAETLHVEDKRKNATFLGAVSATQGDFNMKSRELVVAFTDGTAKNGAAEALPGAGNNEITEIRANGGVILTTKDGQECRSDTAVYKVKLQKVFVEGHVRLSKGANNVMTGEKMIVDLVQGVTTLDNNGGEATGGRASFIAQPEELKKSGAEKKPAE